MTPSKMVTLLGLALFVSGCVSTPISAVSSTPKNAIKKDRMANHSVHNYSIGKVSNRSSNLMIEHLEFRYASDPNRPPEPWTIIDDSMSAHLEHELIFHGCDNPEDEDCFTIFRGEAFIWRRGERELWDILESDVQLNSCNIDFEAPPSPLYRRTIGARSIDLGWATPRDREWLDTRDATHFAGYAKYRFDGGIEVRFKFRTENVCGDWQREEPKT